VDRSTDATSGLEPGVVTVRRKALVATLAGVAILLTAALAANLISETWRVAVLLVICLLIAAVASLLPESVRKNMKTPVGAFVAAVGVLAIFLQTNPDNQAAKPANDNTNTQYLADLVRKGPFTEPLPSPLVAGSLLDVRIADPSSAKKIDAVQLEIKIDPVKAKDFGGLDLQSFAHMEVYSTREEAARRGSASLDDLRRRYQGTVSGTAENFCVDGGNGGDFWTCAGVRDFVYVETTISPAPNANLPFATGTVGAMLRYADRQTDLATT
jgi:hypothetical protein